MLLPKPYNYPKMSDAEKDSPLPIEPLMSDDQAKDAPTREPSSASTPEPLNTITSVVRKVAVKPGLLMCASGEELGVGSEALISEFTVTVSWAVSLTVPLVGVVAWAVAVLVKDGWSAASVT